MGFVDNIKNQDELDAVSQHISWQDFERMVSEIFTEHGYKVKTNAVYTDKGRRAQIDVLAEARDTVIAVDCKHWDKNRYKVSAIKGAVESHIKRCELLAEIIKTKVVPVIVTLYNEDVKFHKDVDIVPLSLLNDWILNLE